MKKVKIAGGTNTNVELPEEWQAQAEAKQQPKPKVKKNKGWWRGLVDAEINAQLDRGFDYASRRTEATAFRYRKMVKGEKYEVYGVDEDECRQKLEQAIKDKEDNFNARENPTLGEWTTNYMTTYLATELNKKNTNKKKAESTLSNYESILRTHVIDAEIGKMRIKSVKEMDLIGPFRQLQSKTPSTARIAVWLLKKVFANAAKNGLIRENPASDMGGFSAPVVKKAKKPNTDIIAIIQHILQEAVSRAEEYHLAYEIGFRMGTRRGEIFGLPIQRIDLENKILTIRQQYVKTNPLAKNLDGTKVERDINYKPATLKDVKTDSSRRELPIPEILVSKIAEQIKKVQQYPNRVTDCCYLDTQDGFVAETDLLFRTADGIMTHPDTPTKVLKKIVATVKEKTGLQIGKDTEALLTSHDMRKLANTLLANKDIAQTKLEALLGHAPLSKDTNARHYTAFDVESLRPAVELLSKIIDGKEPLHNNAGDDTQNNTQN